MRFRATSATAVIVAACLVLLPGCGDKKGKKTVTTTTRFPPTVPVTNVELTEGNGVCGYLTSTEVRAATTINSQPGSGTRGAVNEACRWNLQGNNQFVLLITSGGGPAIFDRSRGQTTGAEDLPGVGDRAYVANDTVYALKGDKVLILQVVTAQAANVRKQAAIALMRNAAPRA